MSASNRSHRPQSDRPSLKQRAAELEAVLARVARRSVPVTANVLDPTFEVIAGYRAAWDALDAAIDASGGEEAPEAEAALSAAYARLRAVRPTTPAGFQALAETWAWRLRAERATLATDGEGTHTVGEHAADSLIAGAGVCVPDAAQAIGDDAVHALIAEHRAAYAEWDRLAAVWNEMVPDDPGYAEAMAASAEPGKREVAAFDALFSARPITQAGTTALASYLVEAVRRTNPNPTPSEGERALSTVAATLRGLEPFQVALDNHADADLLRLGEQLDLAHARWRIAVEQYREPQARLHQALEDARVWGGPTPRQLEAAWNLPGVDEAYTAEERAFDDLDPLREAIWALPAATPAGLAVKARAALVHIWASGSFEADAAEGVEETMGRRAARQLIEACCTLAGVDWRGDPIAPPMPDPIFPAIQRHLAARAECAWRDDGVDKERYDAAHDQRRAALDVVESTRPTTVAGLLALARHMQTYLTEDCEPPEDSQSAQEHAFAGLMRACLALYETRYPGMDRDWAADAAHHPGFLPVPQHQPAALMALEYAIPQEAAHLLALAEAEFERRREAYAGFHDPTVWPSVAAELRRDMRMDALAIVAAPAKSGRLTVGSDQHTAPGLVGMLDLASASMADLQALRETADLVGSTAYAVCWQARCHIREWSERNPLADQYNVAGQLMQWLGEALTDVETAVDHELVRRAPGNSRDRETWLSMRAWPVINDGEPDAIEAFARELLAHAQAERESR